MTAKHPFDVIRKLGKARKYYYSLPALEQAGLGKISRLPISIRIVLESLLRNCDGERVTEKDVRALAAWNAKAPAKSEVPFVVARIVLQDFTGVPLLVDLAAMRAAVDRLGKDPACIEPLVPVDLVVDHSIQVDVAGTPDASKKNVEIEFERNMERYEFLKWGQSAFETFKVIPPSVGIVHQVNLEYLARVVFEVPWQDGQLCYPDTLVGTDSHTTMINGIGIVGWGVGGIEAEAGMLGQPVTFLTPEVIGVELTGQLAEGVTATDLTLTLTQILRAEKVVDKFVEFFGSGARALSLADRATIANMAPEYGATMGFFPFDEQSLRYLKDTGRPEDQIALVEAYLKAQGLFGIPESGAIDYTRVLKLDISSIRPCVSGPKRPQDRIEVKDLKNRFNQLLSASVAEGGFGKSAPAASAQNELKHGSVLIAAITSCTNTSNPSVMIAAGLLAQKACAKGLKVDPRVKTSLGPGSRVVTAYLEATGLQKSLDQLGFHLVGYGCTTCIGNSGPLRPDIEKAIGEADLVAASVLSGNRNFEARVHQSIKANFLMSPPLVVAYALAGRVDIDLETEALGKDSQGKAVFLKDIWPRKSEIEACISKGIKASLFRDNYSDLANINASWSAIDVAEGQLYQWNPESTYIQEPPFFEDFSLQPGRIEPIGAMKTLAIFGDSVTTDHISPAGSFKKDSPAGRFLLEQGVSASDFNSYGSRRGNDRIMTRGTFANVRIKNFMAGGKEGGYTKIGSSNDLTFIYDACEKYKATNTPLIVFGGADYGMGSSRDWAAKGTRLLGVRIVVTKSFERIHRSNLIGMGVLPLEFTGGQDASSLGIDGSETFSLPGLGDNILPGSQLKLIAEKNGARREINVLVRLDTPIEVDYYRHGGILPFVLRQILAKKRSA